LSRLARWATRDARGEVAGHASLYDTEHDPTEREAIQLERLNHEWARTLRHVPYWSRLRERLGLPERWASLDEFVRSAPATGKVTLQEHGADLVSDERPPGLHKATGGSTAEPVQIPKWRSEIAATRPNFWLGRSWYGIDPGDRLFLLWGHSHMLGTGLRGFWNARRQEASDLLLGYCRFSAYDMRPEAMERAVRRLLAFRPRYVLGYSVALDHLAEAAAGHAEALRALGLAAVIATAEGFPSEASGPRIERVFGCPVAMEYGAVETPALAHSLPSGGFRVFWHSYLVEAERRGKRWALRVTSLFPRCLPLIRYEIGDEVDLPSGAPDLVVGLTAFDRLVGRCNDYLELPDGARVHSEAISHAVRPCPSVRAYQVVQEGPKLRLRYTARDVLPAEEAAGLRQRLRRVDPGLGAVALERADTLEQTVAGKTPMIVRR